MLTIEFEINGEKFGIKEVKDPAQREILLSAYSHIVSRLAKVTCPVHGEAPKVTAKGDSAENLTLEVSGCCDRLVDIANVRLSDDPGEV